MIVGGGAPVCCEDPPRCPELTPPTPPTVGFWFWGVSKSLCGWSSGGREYGLDCLPRTAVLRTGVIVGSRGSTASFGPSSTRVYS